MDLKALLPQIRSSLGRAAAAPGAPLHIGAGDAAKPAIIAGIAQEASAPVLIVVPRFGRAHDLVEELSAWLGPEDAARVRLYPQRDILPYERAADDPWDVQQRLETTAAIHAGERVIVVASAESVAQRTLSPAAAKDALGRVALNDRLTPEELLRRLQNSGYEIAPLVEAPGQAARRGGIVDVFPPQAPSPVRIEFFGPNVESIRSFSPETQRSSQRLDSIGLGAAIEFSPDAALANELQGSLDFANMTEEAELTLREELEALARGEAPPTHAFLPALLSPYSLLDHMPANGTVILDEPIDIGRALDEYVAETATMRIEREQRGLLPEGLPPAQANWTDLQPKLGNLPVIELLRFLSEDGAGLRTGFGTAPAFGGRVRVLSQELAQAVRHKEAVVIVSQQAHRLATLLGDEGIPLRSLEDELEAPQPGLVMLLKGSMPHGWTLRADAPVTFLTDAEVFGFVKQRRALKQPGADRSGLIADLSPGDYVVHLEHGIARFTGLIIRNIEGVEREFMELSYAETDRLYVPVDQADRVARYIGPGDTTPSLTRLGSGEWQRTRDRVRRAVADIAIELLDLYAARQMLDGHAFSPDTPWQQEMEASFPYVETPDQLMAIQAVKRDMEAPRPMDRLICGDVGYGKTEVAIRAAFKAVMDGYQVGMLVPTTVLAQQHYNSFAERLTSLPCRVAMLSRFLDDKEAREVVEGVRDGSVDILIGTHRILQKDIEFKQLGLVIIDEEQRFGVAHKERLKQMRKEIDVLTLSATPIPRTLHMSLAGIRDLSNMMTPPEDRIPIRTYVMESDDHIIREAIARELERGGQVFCVHNRVHNIELIAAHIKQLVPDANVGIGHGQMDEHQLARSMSRFSSGELDVLVCTTIIESGLDIPNANTIIINQADRMGLSQLYQLRGRVGRGAVRAYAYLLYDRNRALSETAQKRLQAIFEATELGAGFQIALRDLEIRGAGNLLGAEQSGHMAAIGFDLYVKLLAEAVDRLKAMQRGETPPPPVSMRPGITLDLPLTAYLPDAYIPDLNLRLAVYQRLAQASEEAEVAAIEQELRDRFGALPTAAKNLVWVVRLRLLAAAATIGSVQTENEALVIRTLPGSELDRRGLEGKLPPHSSVTPHMIRLDRGTLGDTWREGLVRTLVAITATAAVPA
ncbi:MAG: transcription-repair coupling factor [Dehalococcoidia bacterium]